MAINKAQVSQIASLSRSYAPAWGIHTELCYWLGMHSHGDRDKREACGLFTVILLF